MELESLGGAHIYIAFDLVFPPELLEHMCRLFNASAHTQYFISTKKNLTSEYSLHAEVVHRVKVNFAGASGASCTLYFYRSVVPRPLCAVSSLHAGCVCSEDVLRQVLAKQQRSLFAALACASLPAESRQRVQKCCCELH